MVRFDHIHLTGKYDAAGQTGHPDYRGHDGGDAMGSGDYYENYGIWAYPRWAGLRTNGYTDNSVKISYFESIKIDYVASFGGGFSCFHLKTQNPVTPGRVSIDVQDCFAGFCKGEGFYIGKTSSPSTSDITSLTMKNNIVVCAGAEAFQTGYLGAGSVIEHNIGLFSGSFFRRPFQAKYQDNGHQLTWAEGGIADEDNLLLGVPGQPLMVFWKNFGTRAEPADSLPITITNNYYGYGRSNAIYMNNGNDDVTSIYVQDNYIDEYATHSTRDAYNSNSSWNVYCRLRPCKNPLTVSGNHFPLDRPLFDSCYQNQETYSYGNLAQQVANPQFMDLGFDSTFDYRNLTFWPATYEKTEKAGQFIPYVVGDVVHSYDSAGHIRFYECIQAHAADQEPSASPAYWEVMTWNGRHMPPLDVRLVPGSLYDSLGIGLEYGASLAENSSNRFRGLLDPAATQIEAQPSFLDLTVYVNPIQDQVEITTDAQAEGTLELWTMHGQQVMQAAVNGEKTIFSAADLATGMYLVRFHDGAWVVSRKIMIRH